jgi:hypothetical protein
MDEIALVPGFESLQTSFCMRMDGVVHTECPGDLHFIRFQELIFNRCGAGTDVYVIASNQGRITTVLYTLTMRICGVRGRYPSRVMRSSDPQRLFSSMHQQKSPLARRFTSALCTEQQAPRLTPTALAYPIIRQGTSPNSGMMDIDLEYDY